MPPFDKIELKERAAHEAGLSEFGEDAFRAFFDRFIDALNGEGAMTAHGIALTRSEILSHLRNRLEVRRWLDEVPAISAQSIDQPVFLMGLPRSGTTFLHHLFDHDPALRLLRTWETLRPCPPPAIDPKSVEDRLDAARRFVGLWQADVTNFEATHLLDPDGPDECTHILSQAFAMVGFLNVMKVDRFFHWLSDEADFHAVYRYHRSVLQLLQWQSPARRWVLKYPNYLLSMQALSDVYPGALFVVTHRDPVRTLASLCELTHQYRAPRYADNDRSQIGREMWAFVQKHIDRQLAFRRSGVGAQVVDVDYYQLVSDPVATTESVYAAMGRDMPSAVRLNLADWTKRNPKGKRGARSYQLESFGLDRKAIEPGFADYRNTFDIPEEED